ncbi:MAG: polymer-forming cytoskeletal protein [Sinobacteraceae bacterium]|nr:polymer-forming cytoskeletal protein [Nevskiaceae bacterium]
MWGQDNKRAQGAALRRKPAHTVDTLVGRQTEICGDLHFTGGLHLDGNIHGQVFTEDADGVLSVSETGMVEGDVQVAHIMLKGRIRGEVRVTEKAILGATARIDGNVHYCDIEISSGAIVNGQMIYAGRAEEPSEALAAGENARGHNAAPEPLGSTQPASGPDSDSGESARPVGDVP